MACGLHLLPLCNRRFFTSSAPSLVLSDITGTIRAVSLTKAKLSFHARCIQGYQGSCTSFKQLEENGVTQEVSEQNEIGQKKEVIREILLSIDDGNLSVSAYDTAWVALVKDINGGDVPQFPSSLEWIINNQLQDGSWGDRYFFSIYDRLSCTLACVVALTTWNHYPEKCEKGTYFLRQNLHKLRDEDPEHMPSGFEVRFPSLIEMAQNLGLEISHDYTLLQDLYATRAQKLNRIPKEMLHNVPTTLLYSLEGMPDLEWEKLLKLQHPNGSFLCSTASTAYALDQTKNEKCFKYLKEIVKRFNGGVPHCYPVDIFERLWVVDRLERLGLSRYFKSEIEECLDHVYRYWTPNGISWTRDSTELDIDDTSMGFRILRLHGYVVNADAYYHFEKDGQFFCFVGQTSQGITEMLSLFRASQILFPGEQILEETKKFSSKFLKEKYNLEQVADRWLITKDLLGEVKYYLDFPWYASLPRLETRYYIDLYGGKEDVWIGKVLYRMYNVSNNLYLDLAKLDYNHCQKLHQIEWTDIQRWYNMLDLRVFAINKDGLLNAYFLAMSNIYEPEREIERLAWAKTFSLTKVVFSYFKSISNEQKKDFIEAFLKLDFHANSRLSSPKGTNYKLVEAIFTTMTDISFKVWEVHGKEVKHSIKNIWNAWILNRMDEAEFIVCIINLCAGHSLSTDLTSQRDYIRLTNLTNEICRCLGQIDNVKYNEEININLQKKSIELQMQELVQLVVNKSDGINPEIKLTFLHVAKSYYYTSYYEPAAINIHIKKVLFDTII